MLSKKYSKKYFIKYSKKYKNKTIRLNVKGLNDKNSNKRHIKNKLIGGNSISTLDIPQIIFNYKTNNQIKIHASNPPMVLFDKALGYMEPTILFNNVNSDGYDNNKKYLVALVENNSRLLWLALFNKRFKIKTILSYIKPKLQPGQIRDYTFSFYQLFDSNTPVYTTIDLSGETDRQNEFIKFRIYIEQNKQTIKQILNINIKINGGIKKGNIGLDVFKMTSKLANQSRYNYVKPNYEKMVKFH